MNQQDYLKQYKSRLRNLDSPDGTELNEQLVLLTRDKIADFEWSAHDRASIERLDDQLVKRWKQFQGLLPLYAFQDRSRWWWFLNEGPQVKAEAEQAQRLPA